MNSTLETNLDHKSIQFEYFCGQIGSTVAKKNCNFTQDYEFHSDDFANTIQTKVLMEMKKSLNTTSSENNGNFSNIHYYIAIGIIIVLLAFATTTVVSYRYSKRHEKTPDPITVEESEGEPEELGAKKFSRDLTGMFSINL